MAAYHMSRMARDLAVELSLDAAIEIEEALQGLRSDAPALASLAAALTGGTAGEIPRVSPINSQITALYHRAMPHSSGEYATTADLHPVVSLLSAVGAKELTQLPREELALLRDFCLGINRELVSEAYRRTPEPQAVRNNPKEFALYAH